ncbi:response regulator transcription factor [Paraburkholderia atlantica]|uniref:Response regulator receiver protein n=1 Tax=Paraburkholderia atlantica TaxID=2654982 RepID=D5WLB2_PARAM|nr:response regulator [Paraburkholderia atlantica]ADG20008.1 response regulator receiver protein [Paraburkholderia atlantica]MBB5507882.1 FixJ family two-component response regulator [Paraburkholderia atlantica]
MRVTLVDDDEAVRESLSNLVRAFGFAVSVFSSAESFLASGVVDQTDCLLLDVSMPGMGGPALFRELKRLGKGVPVVFITAHKDGAFRNHLTAQGAYDCLFKPFSDTVLLATLKGAASK